MKAICLFIFLVSVCIAGYSQQSLKLVFAGDVMGHDSQIQSAYDASTGKYNYNACFEYIKPYIEQADIAIANLEVTLAGPPYKGYPQFSSPDELAVALKNSGFDILITANNHSLDRGKKGLERTIDVLDSLSVLHTGTFKNQEERSVKHPLFINKNGIKVALLNYTYGTNGLTTEYPNIVNYIDTAVMKADIGIAFQQKADFLIVTIHWGTEYENVENYTQQKLANWLFKSGVDAIVGMHPHVVQPVKKIFPQKTDSSNFKLVAYSLGNFISNQRKRYTDGGILFELNLMKNDEFTFIDSYYYLPVWVYKPVENGKTIFRIIPAKEEEYKFSVEMDEETRQQRKIFYEDTKQLLQNTPERGLKEP